MVDQENIVDVNLAPGEFFFGSGQTRIHTLLGSCVAITMWHPRLLIGGMCHYLLPTRGTQKNISKGYYADDAIQLFLEAIKQHGTRPQEYETKLFGGSNMFTLSDHQNMASVSRSNVEIGPHFLIDHGFKIKATDLGGTFHRKIYLELWSGVVWVRHGDSAGQISRGLG